tara:strand:- start:216 stop:944 length:729 start_codon:yes stop_codon:yes gene_type:complete
MKNLLIFSTLVLAIVISGCGGGGSGGSPPTPSINTLDYEFTVIIDGVVNKVKGTGPWGQLMDANIPRDNFPYGGVYLGLSDITSSNYVEGYPFTLFLSFEANILGKVRASIHLDGRGSSFYRDKYTSTNWPLGQEEYAFILVSDTSNFTNMDYTLWQYLNTSSAVGSSITPLQPNFDIISSDIQITDLGTIGVNAKTLKGYMPKTKLFYPMAYTMDGPTAKYSVTWSPPIELEFSFKAIRFN